MLVEFKKTDLTIETSGFIPKGILVISEEEGGGVSSSPAGNLAFEGFAGFNEKYVYPILDLLCNQSSKNVITYKVLKVSGNLHNDSSKHSAEFYMMKSTRDTLFLFKIFKSYGINLTELRLGLETDSDKPTIYLDKRILKVLSTLDEDSKRELGFFICCLARLFYALNTTNITLGTSVDGVISVFKSQLDELVKNYGTIPNSFMVDFIPLKEDVSFDSISYVHNTYIPYLKDTSANKYSSTFVYNIFKGAGELLCLINLNTKEYYVINMATGTVFTNNELKEYNTFDFNEWIPNLVINIANVVSLPEYTVKYLPLDKLLRTTAKELIISNDATNFEKLLECYPNIFENNNMTLYEGYFKGCTLKIEGAVNNLKSEYDNDMYAQELYKQVQPYYDSFDLKDLTGIVKGFANGAVYSMLFEGESGTGKSTAARVIASKCGIPFVAINCSTNIEESDIFGTMIPNPTKNSADDAEFIWQDGPLTKAIRNGYVGIVEELGFGRPGVLGKINSLLDEARQIDLPNGEVLKAHKNFRLIATTNIGYEGTNRLNKALVNRFEICKKFIDLDDKEAKDVIMARTGYSDITKINKIFDVYRAIKKYNSEQNLGIVISIRQLLNIFKQGKYYKNAKDAVNNLMLNQAFLEEPEHLQYFVTTVLNVFDLSFKI